MILIGLYSHQYILNLLFVHSHIQRSVSQIGTTSFFSVVTYGQKTVNQTNSPPSHLSFSGVIKTAHLEVKTSQTKRMEDSFGKP